MRACQVRHVREDGRMVWQTRTRTFDLAAHGLIMGVLNVTTDSFSDGGRYFAPEAAEAHAIEMEREGAAIIDVGGESTRPGAEPVEEAEELARVIPVIERLAARLTSAIISIDTMKAAVARKAVRAGAEIVNDVSGLRDEAMLDVVRETGAGAVAMHMQGTPRNMQIAPHYSDVSAEIRENFRQTFARALASGIDPLAMAFDPGIGFGKTVQHNLTLIRNLDSLRVKDRPLVLGVSRKSFLGKIAGGEGFNDRSWPTVALTSLGRELGANVFRVHEVKPNAQALRMTEAILG
jgi:dihydropteroate synthase